jgi:hypothetical protein
MAALAGELLTAMATTVRLSADARSGGLLTIPPFDART